MCTCFYCCTHFVYWFVKWLSFILDFLRLIVLIFHLLTVHLWFLRFWWYIFIITFKGILSFRRVVFSTFFNCLICFIPYCYIWGFSEFSLVGTFCIYFFLLISITYFVIFVYSTIPCSKWATVNLYFTKIIQVRNR